VLAFSDKNQRSTWWLVLTVVVFITSFYCLLIYILSLSISALIPAVPNYAFLFALFSSFTRPLVAHVHPSALAFFQLSLQYHCSMRFPAFQKQCETDSHFRAFDKF